MILAAGQGTRLHPLTLTCPKPMIPVADRPLLEYIVRLLARHDFTDLAINLHHLPEQVTSHFGAGADFGVDITYSHEQELLGTAGAVRQMAPFFDQPFLVYYGDNLTNVDLTALWTQHRQSGALATVGLLWMDDPSSRGIVQLDGDNRIRQVIEKPRPDQVFADYLVNGGIYAFDPEILNYIPPGPSDFAADIFPALLQQGAPLYGHRLIGQLLSTDTPQRYAHARRQVAAGTFTLP
ncbi:MAG: NTP transferase domain-containing protein [Candidatus Latescibacteria bacterium]|nr:NTP transferase domain-containing protein [Candidatus Latescibacterota bacterium]